MLKHQFIQLIKQPKAQLQISQQQLAELDALINEYPFFQSAHLLYTKGLHSTNAINYAKQLRKTAIVANSRGILYELLHQKNNVVAPIIDTKIIEEKKEVVVEKTIIKEEKIAVQAIIETEKEVAKPIQISPVTITNNDIKVIYVNTVPSYKTEQQAPIIEKEIPNNELNILKDVENETTFDEIEEEKIFDEQKLNTQIESEINRGVIQSYVETDIIKTPELTKEKVDEPLSFTAWLEKVKKESGTIQKNESNTEKNTEKNTKTAPKSPEFQQKKNIIDKIIESDPGRIKFGTQKFFTPQLDAKQSLLENEHLVTETLAKIYALQGNNSKAIRAYEILSLKFPQKSVYFATLIQNLKTNK